MYMYNSMTLGPIHIHVSTHVLYIRVTMAEYIFQVAIVHGWLYVYYRESIVLGNVDFPMCIYIIVVYKRLQWSDGLKNIYVYV